MPSLVGSEMCIRDRQQELDPVYWRFVLMLPILTCTFRFLSFIWFYRFETPQYYVSKQQNQEAIQVLRYIYNSENVTSQLANIQQEIKSEDKGSSSSFFDIFNKEKRKRTMAGILTLVFQQTSGINAIVLFSCQIFQQVIKGSDEYKQQQAKYLTIYQGILLTVTPFATGFILARVGRKTMLVIGQLLLGLMCFIISCMISGESSSYLVVFLFLYDIVFGLTLGPVAWVYCADILQSQQMSVAAGGNWVSGFFIALTSPLLPMNTVFLVYSLCCIVGGIYFQYNILETRGLTTNMIIKMFDKTSSKIPKEIEDV
eukprot:TRINITY_DN12584_c0_g1_i1.p1 TRINITY_DN12584_c0_g1~~TRINITY_DN12584_c0_g1_i1.p1  ORF type:complete len:314 (+),score=44.76 TRINITY_DN12584_c0_g1_i1:94-1035(+)